MRAGDATGEDVFWAACDKFTSQSKGEGELAKDAAFGLAQLTTMKDRLFSRHG